MIRLIQRRLIIPRGDTGSFTIPILTAAQGDCAAVFSIIEPATRSILFQKLAQIDDNITISFTHNDTVVLPVGQYLWDIKFYQNPVYEQGMVVNGDEVDSYYAGYSLPTCEIRPTGDNLPKNALNDEQNRMVSAALKALEAGVQQTETNIQRYPIVQNDYWWTWDALQNQYVNTHTKATGNGIASARFNEDYTITLVLEDGQTITTEPVSMPQSDWNETDETSASFIRNKPNIQSSNVTIVTADWSLTQPQLNLTAAELIEAMRNGIVYLDLTGWLLDTELISEGLSSLMGYMCLNDIYEFNFEIVSTFSAATLNDYPVLNRER